MNQKELFKLIVTALVASLVSGLIGGAIGDARATANWRPVVEVRLAGIQASVDTLVSDWKRDHETILKHVSAIEEINRENARQDREIDNLKRRAGLLGSNAQAGDPFIADKAKSP